MFRKCSDKWTIKLVLNSMTFVISIEIFTDFVRFILCGLHLTKFSISQRMYQWSFNRLSSTPYLDAYARHINQLKKKRSSLLLALVNFKNYSCNNNKTGNNTRTIIQLDYNYYVIIKKSRLIFFLFAFTQFFIYSVFLLLLLWMSPQ